MQIVDHNVEYIYSTPDALKLIANTARVAYAKQRQTTEAEDLRTVRDLIKRGHTEPIEVAFMQFKVTTNRYISHALVRHRMGSYCQESTHYIDYSKGNMCFIRPLNDNESYLNSWEKHCARSEQLYSEAILAGIPAQEARDLLPGSLATTLMMNLNVTSWRNFYRQRVLGKTGKDQNQMVHVATLICEQITQIWPWALEQYD